MSLNIMIAGCRKDERTRIEAAVRAAFTGRPDTEPWNVSLVQVANQWSIDIDGPEPQFKGMSLAAPASDLTASLQQALADAASAGNGESPTPKAPEASPTPTAPEASPTPTAPKASPTPKAPEAPEAPEAPGGNGAPAAAAAPAGTRKERHQCEECAAAFEVIFDQQPGEPEELCPVACPACWHVNKVPIAQAAGTTGDYRAQTVGT